MTESRSQRRSGPLTWGKLRYMRIEGTCMAPRVPEGAFVGVDTETIPARGDVLVVHDGGTRLVAELGEWGGARWLVRADGSPPQPLVPPLEILGVVRLVVQQL